MHFFGRFRDENGVCLRSLFSGLTSSEYIGEHGYLFIMKKSVRLHYAGHGSVVGVSSLLHKYI